MNTRISSTSKINLTAAVEMIRLIRATRPKNPEYALPNLLRFGEEVYVVKPDGTLCSEYPRLATGTRIDWMGICGCCLERLLAEAVILQSDEPIILQPLCINDSSNITRLTFHAGGKETGSLYPWTTTK